MLGAYPSGLHVTWAPPTLPGLATKSIRAMIVDNEPVPFWNGTDADVRFEEWVSAVGWQSEWGEARPAPSEATGRQGSGWTSTS